MKEIECPSGNKYGIVTAYGVMSQLEGAALSNVSDETMERLKQRMVAQGGSLDEFEDEAGMKAMEYFDGASLRDFLEASRRSAPETLATVIRTVNGEAIPKEDRLRYVNEELDFEDGSTIMNAVEESLRAVQKGKAKSGKSRPGSQKQTAEELGLPPVN
jgi:transcriptional regulator with XRE-family HTH domain